MIQILQQHIDQALTDYSAGAHYDSMLEAKKKYFELTGSLTEADDEFESKMNSFNDWYLFQYLSPRSTITVMKDYLDKNKVEDEVSLAFLSINHSLFEFSKTSWGGKIILNDILHKEKIELSEDSVPLGLVEKDIFSGRIINFQDQNYPFQGICIYPSTVKSILQKEAKKVRKMKNPKAEAKFLLFAEGLKTKWIHYGHIDAKKIFDVEFPSI